MNNIEACRVHFQKNSEKFIRKMLNMQQPLEADTRTLIDKSLENLGWKLTGQDKNVFLEQPRTESERKKLNGKRADYVLYSTQSDKPVIIIEAKKKGERIDKALEQGIDYARALEAPLVFATDGLFCKSYHTKFDKTPLLNGDEVDEFIRERLALEFLKDWNVNTISKAVQYSRQELIKIFNEANNTLRGEGLRAGIERFSEFANILFLKLISESEGIKEEQTGKSVLEYSFRWNYIKELNPSARIDYINNVVYQKMNDLYGGGQIFDKLAIKSSKTLSQIIDKLDPLTLTDINSDVKGDAFEYFLRESTASGNDLGEYFTPRHIVKAMVKLANPQIGEKVYDPFCGTGGLLIESFRHIWNMMPRNSSTEEMLKKYTIFGNEITNTARITKMNMILAGDGHSNIAMKDSLAHPMEGKYDVVLTNMPYSQKSDYASLYDVKTNNGDSICVQHCMKAISSTSENGRMAIVVPEGFLFRKDLAKTREYLLERCNLQSIISLPQGVFLPYTGVKTNILYATQVNQRPNKSRTHYWYFEVKNDGYTLDNHRRKTEGSNDLENYQEYRKLDDEQTKGMLEVGFNKIAFDEVRKNSYILIGNRYKQRDLHSKFEILSLKDICSVIAGQSPAGKFYNSNHEGLPFYQGNADFGVMYLKSPRHWTTQVTKKAIKNDILLSVRAPVGAVNICSENVCIGRGLMALRPLEKLDFRFLFYVLSQNSYRLREAAPGSTFEAVTKQQVEEFKIPVPPLEIQKQIIEELDRYQAIINLNRKLIQINEAKIRDKLNSLWQSKDKVPEKNEPIADRGLFDSL